MANQPEQPDDGYIPFEGRDSARRVVSGDATRRFMEALVPVLERAATETPTLEEQERVRHVVAQIHERLACG